MRILIVEDQENLAQMLKESLEKEGCAVDYLIDGESAQKRILLHHMDYDLIILDLMLPKKSGFEICRDTRAKNITTPILVLTAKDSVEDKTQLLNSGADDYLVKPFSFKELLSRIRAILRRPKEVLLPAKLQTKDLILDPATKKALYKGKEIKLSLKEFALLEYLIRNGNKIVNREQILSNLWDFAFDSFSNVVDVHINNLRKKLKNNNNGGTQIIETVRGIGYRIKV
jgi:DNA-binding response OmpR family regulator